MQMPESTSQNCPAQPALRTAAKIARANLTAGYRQTASLDIATKIVAADIFRNANSIACYIPLPTEVDTWPIIKRAWEEKKRIFAPCVEKTSTLRFYRLEKNSDLLPNKFGIQEPERGELIRPDALDLILLPLVAFDSNRNRIGMGGGYYDRSFSFLRNDYSRMKPLLVGLAFDCQRADKITSNPWDMRLHSVFTETTLVIDAQN